MQLQCNQRIMNKVTKCCGSILLLGLLLACDADNSEKIDNASVSNSAGAIGASQQSDNVVALQYKEGEHYYRLANRQPVRVAEGQIEVIEFFSYACPHCRDFDPFMQQWKKDKPDNVVVRLVPAVFRKEWEPLARAYYTLQAMGKLDAMHTVIFEMIHGSHHVHLHSLEQMIAAFRSYDIDTSEFARIYSSEDVQAQLDRDSQMLKDYQIQYVPTVAVHGEYTTYGSQSGSFQDMIKLLDVLIKQLESEDKT